MSQPADFDPTRPGAMPEESPRPARKRLPLSTAPEPDGLEPEQWIEALRRDFRRRWRRKRYVRVEDYLLRFPPLADNEQGILDLIYQEVLLREHDGEAPCQDDYLRRFPHLGPALEKQFEIHAILGSDSAMDLLVEESIPGSLPRTPDPPPVLPAAAAAEAPQPASAPVPSTSKAHAIALIGPEPQTLAGAVAEPLPVVSPGQASQEGQPRLILVGLMGVALGAMVAGAAAWAFLTGFKPDEPSRSEPGLAHGAPTTPPESAAKDQPEPRRGLPGDGQQERQHFEALKNAALQAALPATADDPAPDLARVQELTSRAVAAALAPVSEPGASATAVVLPWVASLGPAGRIEVQADLYELLLQAAEVTAQLDGSQAGTAAALGWLDRAAALAFQTRAACLLRSNLLERLGDAEGARHERARAATLLMEKGRPDLGRPGTLPSILALDCFRLGLDRLNQNEHDEAVAILEEAVRLYPAHFGARYALALALLQAGQHETAESHFAKCIADQPRFVWSHIHRGRVRTELGTRARCGA